MNAWGGKEMIVWLSFLYRPIGVALLFSQNPYPFP